MNAQDFGASDASQINSTCGPEGGETGSFKDNINSVVLIIAPDGTKSWGDNIIHDNGWFGTGVIVNNTRYDGEMYLLTASHLIPHEDDLDKLSEFKFIFGYESPECNPGQEPTEYLTLTGASLVAIDNLSLFEIGMLNTSDVALLRLNKKVRADLKEVYYSGWNFNDDVFDMITMIHHPMSDVKKIATFNAFDTSSTNLFFNGNDIWRTPFDEASDIRPFRYEYINRDNIIGGFMEPGSSGGPIFNDDNQVIGLVSGGTIPRPGFFTPPNGEPHANWFSKLSYAWKWGDTNEMFILDENNRNIFNIGDYLDPDDEGVMKLNGAPTCIQGVDGMPLNDQSRFLKTLTIDEAFDGNTNSNYIAIDRIDMSSSIAPGARMLVTAGEINLLEGTDIRAGDNEATDVLIVPGENYGIGCVTGCYGIVTPENPEYFLSNGSCFAKGIENAQKYKVQITLGNGLTLIIDEKPVQGTTVKLFELLDLNQNASDVKNTTITVKATFTNDCDEPKEITFQIPFDDTLEDNAFLSDYYHYKEDPLHSNKMPDIADYMTNKLNLTQWYEPSTSFDTYSYPEDVLFEIAVERDITYATASGYEWNFRGGKGYRSINPAITTGNGESSSHHTQIIGNHHFVENGALKMDIYYPKLKPGITITQAPSLPVICYVFGGGYVTHDQPELGDEICRWFAQKGYIVAFIDYRIGADLTNSEVSKRAPMRAWQDVNAAVQFLRMQGQKVILASDKWKIDPNKIYGNGWSAGAIASLHNLTLNQTQYQTERNDGNFLEFTKAGKTYTSLNIPYTTYDLDAYPTTPCQPGETDCSGSTVDAQFNAVGVFAGAIGKADWLNNLQRSAIDIHHHDDEIVLWGEGKPFKNVAPKTNFVGLTQVPPLYGGGYLKEKFPNKSQFDVVTLTEEWQAGGKPTDWLSAGKLHAAMIKWGDRAGVNHPARLENKEMFLLDGFFMLQNPSNNGPNQRMVNSNNTKTVESTETPSTIIPNPSSDATTLVFETKQAGTIKFEFLSLDGRLLYSIEENIEQAGKQEVLLTTSKLQDGLYLIRGTGAGVNFSTKLIIKRE